MHAATEWLEAQAWILLSVIALANHKARTLCPRRGRFLHKLTTERKGKLAGGIDFGSGEMWGGLEAHKLGLVNGVSTLEQVVKSRWPDLDIHFFGTGGASGLPLIGTTLAEALDYLGIVGPDASSAAGLR